MSGLLIAFEGGEGTGKSTQARLLAERLGAVLTREPGATQVGARIRALLLDDDPGPAGLDARAEALLMAADRAQHVAEVVRPSLEGGRSVVSDRSAYSSLAYQGYGRGLGADAVRQVCEWATAGMRPDLVVLLEVPSPVSVERMGAHLDRLEGAGDAFHARVAEGFVALAAEEQDRWAVVPGVGSVEEVAARVASAYDEWVERRG